MKIPPLPTRAPARDPRDWRYWDAPDLESELRRTFEVCHGCRMCVSYCGSFPDLFRRVDRDIETRGAEGAELLSAEDCDAVTDLCWQCKLCYIDCPYTPDQGHAWALDFPRVLSRQKANRARRDGVTLQDMALGEPGRLGQLVAGPLAGVTNLVNANRLVRKANEKVLGISAEFPIPTFASQPFATWLARHTPAKTAGQAGAIALFATCLGDYNFPRIAQAAVQVLEHNGFADTRPEQQCCGIPNLDGGDVEAATAKARFNVASLLREIEAGKTVVCPGPSCSYTIRKDYPDLLGTAEARTVAANTLDLMEFLDRLRREKRLDTTFASGLGKVAYHAACHLRAQKIGTPGARVLGLLPDTEVEIVEKCSAVDGTWGMKAEHYDMGRRYADKLARGIERAEATTVVTDCPLSARRIEKENSVAVLHPAEALARAYGIAQGTP